jgi:transcriptional regulator with XRE-family HTH domain
MARELRPVLRDLGLRIRELRRRVDLTQEAAAEKIGMLTPNYARIEQGRMNVTVDTLLRISNALDVALPELFKPPKVRNVKPGRPPKETTPKRSRERPVRRS